ncbi:MAG: hypothetical protein EPN25_09040 [Nitrospirae bacterium]|nr:MAG: hypothetical protein EPN25_09040 [Nitrospirota bacterium]
MKRSRLILLVMVAALAGCIQSIALNDAGDLAAIPAIDYTAYWYSSGEGESLRAVFLKIPESGVEVIPYSVQITTGRTTPGEARSFMARGSHNRNVNSQSVSYKGKPIGYLFTNAYHSFSRDTVEVSLFERDGKVYLSVWEKKHDD